MIWKYLFIYSKCNLLLLLLLNHLVSDGGPLQRNVLVLASFEDLLVDAVQAYGIRIGLSGDLVVLAGQVLHAAHLAAQLVDVADLTHATDSLLTFVGNKY